MLYKMSITKNTFKKLIKGFNFPSLFIEELGWDNPKSKTKIPISVLGKRLFQLQPLAEKSGFKILLCSADEKGLTPDYQTRQYVHFQATKLFQEHIVIYANTAQTEQIWQVPVRKVGQPMRLIETRWNKNQDPELLFQRAAGILFDLDEEGNITIVDVTQRVSANFAANADKVTKKFYDGFKKEHTAFLAFIKGIDANLDKDWYASLMLNRLMFCYFIQKKGFLNQDRDYLRNHLNKSAERLGKDKFYSFYRSFLLRLFHQVLNMSQHTELEHEFGQIPYLNGGLFDVHELESNYEDIQISDDAFKRIFDFFDQYEWHLDTRSGATGKEVNPDVIGYIFEKYINDRAAMGAYYTKEDITEYIAKNCILPYLFEETQRLYSTDFATDLLKNNPDKYIYDAFKFGISPDNQAFIDLPKEIQQGINPPLALIEHDVTALADLRKNWNKPAPSEIALPTETYRELIERRQRYAYVYTQLKTGKVEHINDFITLNLNIRQYAQDLIESTQNPQWLGHFYDTLKNVTILDPTCGSGAFLFAALNILEPLYEACIQRMQIFVDEENRLNAAQREVFRNDFANFRIILAHIKSPQHPNLPYFIYKSIILQNLYGVDIMREATEIAKLRLFLKLVATVDADYSKPNLGIEPLPDVDFNIKAGNTLIGFANKHDLERGLRYELTGSTELPKIEEKLKRVAVAFKEYQNLQTSDDPNDGFTLKASKATLKVRLTELNQRLNNALGKQYGETERIPEKWKKFLQSHQPFHWLSEFYEIIEERKGFDVIIGNPPYVEYSKVKKTYTIKNYVTESAGNLFAIISERAKMFSKEDSYFSFIVPISIVCTQRMEILQKSIFPKSKVWISNYAERPGKLFSGAEVLLTIFIAKRESEINSKIGTTGFIKWTSEQRDNLFELINYNDVIEKPKTYSIPKFSSEIENEIIKKMKLGRGLLGRSFLSKSNHTLFYRIGGGRYFKVFTDFQPSFFLNGKASVSSRESNLYFDNNEFRNASISILSSTLFYWYFIMTTNCRDLNPSDLKEFPINLADISEPILSSLSTLCEKIMIDYREKSLIKDKVSTQTGEIRYQEFYPRLSKPLLDEIDKVLAIHYGFSGAELDFILNYDIKYRMGASAQEEDE